jgi:hypothetical protein
MAKGQASISTTGDLEPILQEAYRAFPDVERGNDAQAYRRILWDWFINRTSGSKGAKLDSIKDDTRLIPLMDEKLNSIIARLDDSVEG